MKYDTTYTNLKGEEFEAVQIPWDLVEEILGHTHEGTPENDQALVRCLIAQPDCPAWVDDAEGWVDENGWGLIGPRKEEVELVGLGCLNPSS